MHRQTTNTATDQNTHLVNSITLPINRGQHPIFLEDTGASPDTRAYKVLSKRGQMPHARDKSYQLKKRNKGGSSPAFEPTAFIMRLISTPTHGWSFTSRPFCLGLKGRSAPSSYSSWMRTWRSPLTLKGCTLLIYIAANILPAAPPHWLSWQAKKQPYLSPPCSSTA